MTLSSWVVFGAIVFAGLNGMIWKIMTSIFQHYRVLREKKLFVELNRQHILWNLTLQQWEVVFKGECICWVWRIKIYQQINHTVQNFLVYVPFVPPQNRFWQYASIILLEKYMYYFWSVLFLISISSVKKWKSLNDIMEKQDKNGLCKTYGTKYSKVDQVNFMEDKPLKNLKGYGLKGCLSQNLLKPLLKTLPRILWGFFRK